MLKKVLLSLSVLFFFSACDTNTNQKQMVPNPTTETKNLLNGSKQHNEINGKSLALRCIACHGKHFEKAALSKSMIVKGQSAEVIEASLQAYKAGTYNKAGLGQLMHGQVINLSDHEIKTIAEYIGNIK